MLLLYNASLAAAAYAAEGNPDELNNSKKQSPCCVAQQLLAPCQSSISPDCRVPLQTNQITLGSMCACNTVVFNLWAACIQGWGNQNQSLSFSDWTYPCSGNGSTVTYKDYPLHEDVQGVDIPSWAYLNITKEDTFDIFGALNDVRKWTPVQILAPIVVGITSFMLFTIGFLFYRRSHKKKKKYSGGSSDQGSLNFSWNGTLNRFGFIPGIINIQSGRGRYDQEWAIDDFDERTMRRTPDFEGHRGEECSSPISIPPSPSIPTTQKIQEYLKRSRRFLRNPFKGRPVKVISTQPRKGFRVDESDLGGGSRRPTVDTLSSGYDNRDEENDENTVLLITKTPGVDFDSNDGHGVKVDVVPPSRPVSYSHSHNQSVESILRPSPSDPTMLFPASVRAAGYTGVPNPGLMHGRNVSASSVLSTNTPMTH